LIGSKKWTRLHGVPTTSEFESKLRAAALRVTRPRVAVLSAVHDHPHADTDSIIGFVRDDHGEVSHQAVYDVLRALTAARLVRRFEPMGSVARYEARVGDDHHHVVCRSCGAIADVDGAVRAGGQQDERSGQDERGGQQDERRGQQDDPGGQQDDPGGQRDEPGGQRDEPGCLRAADGSGYMIDEAEVIYWGRCPRCVAAGATPPDG
jgi:Fe2+ or Zn2+ uptake regulation protein